MVICNTERSSRLALHLRDGMILERGLNLTLVGCTYADDSTRLPLASVLPELQPRGCDTACDPFCALAPSGYTEDVLETFHQHRTQGFR